MHAHNHRVLVENGVTPMDSAILSAGNYFLAQHPNQLLIHAQLGSEDDFSTNELKTAAHNCLRHGWILQNEEGIVLTEEGRQLKDRLSLELKETVELLQDRC